jgi:hypothetical protein
VPKIPENIRRQLAIAQKACDELERISAASGNGHKFTLDGRFVGDIGELLAAQNFDIRPHQTQKHCHDGNCRVNGLDVGVQIKCRRKSTVIDFYSQPKLLLVIEIDQDWESWETVYNGPGDFLSRDEGFTTDEAGRLFRNGKKEGRRVYLDELRQLSRELSRGAPEIPRRRRA